MEHVDILLIIPPFHRRNGSGKIFPMGTGYIISSLIEAKLSWKIINCTEIIESCYDDDLAKLDSVLSKQLNNISPIVIGIGPCVTSQLKSLIVIAKACNTQLPKVPLFAGGPFASIKGQEIVFYETIGIKYLIKGDGEKSVVEAVKTVKQGKNLCDCSCVSFRGKEVINCIPNIDNILFPYRPNDDDEFSLRRKNANGQKGRMMPMIASRGCVYSCDYCVSGNMKKSGISYRRRTNTNIVDEIVFLYNEHRARTIVFYDDCFFPKSNTVNEEIDSFCVLLSSKGLDIEWQIEMRTDVFVHISAESLTRLKLAGCSQINLGIEKLTDQGLAYIGKKAECVGLDKQIKLATNKGIKISATFILGGGKETEKDIIDMIDGTMKLGLSFAQFSPLFVYPGTPLYSRQFFSPTDWVNAVMNDPLPWGEIIYNNENISCERILELVDFAYEEFYKGTEYAQYQMIEDRFNIKRNRSDSIHESYL